MGIIVSWQQRVARAEAMVDKQLSELPEIQEQALDIAISQMDTETAAKIARDIRNRLLEKSDAQVALDRLGLKAPTETSFSAWITFLRTLGEALSGEWAKYRQALRDLPEQEGFPLNIQWPIAPFTGENVSSGDDK